MGDLGSGRWNNYTKKRIVEDCWILDLARFPLKDSATDPPRGFLLASRINGGELPLPVDYAFVEEGEDAPYLDITHLTGRRGSVEDVEERVKLLSTRPHFGGVRWYFSCPFTIEGERCGNRVRILYLPPGERRFGCRKCHNLTYESSQQSHRYDGLCAFLAGGEREGATFEFLKWAFSYLLREARKQRAGTKGGD